MPTPEALNSQDILTPDELAARLKTSKHWIFEKTRARTRDKLPCFRLGRFIRFYWPDVSMWLTARSTGVRKPNGKRLGQVSNAA